MKTDSIEKEIEGYNADKKEIENILNSSIISYAEEIKKNGGDILKELSNPQLNQSIKHNKKYRFKMWWNDMKIKLNKYFF
jgi:hypothetical protein